MVRGSFARAGEVLEEEDLEAAVDRLRESVLHSDIGSLPDTSVYGVLDAVLATRLERKQSEEAELNDANQRYRGETVRPTPNCSSTQIDTSQDCVAKVVSITWMCFNR